MAKINFTFDLSSLMDTALNADKLPYTTICIKKITWAQPRKLRKKKSELCSYENILAAILRENGNSHKERDLLEEF